MGATPQDNNNNNTNNNTNNNNEKQLRLRGTVEFSEAVDTIVIVDCTSNPTGVKRVAKAFCKKEETERQAKDQIALVQTCSPLNTTKSALSSNYSNFYDLVDDLVATNVTVSVLAPTLRYCHSLFELSKHRDNKKQVVIISDGDFDDSVYAAPLCRSLVQDFHATVKVITVGVQPNRVELASYASPRCLFNLTDYENTVRQSNDTREYELPRNIQMTAKLLFPHGNPLCFGEDVQLLVELQNVGTQEIAEGSRMIFTKNAYFKANFVKIPKLGADETTNIRVTLVTHIKGKGHLEQQLADLPEIIPFLFVDQNNHTIPSYYDGIYLDMQDFSGDIILYKPLFDVEKINVLLAGAIGAGKSSFVNSMISALGPIVRNVNYEGRYHNVVTSRLSKFVMNELQHYDRLNFNIYDAPGIDSSNYAGEEFPLTLHGIMPLDVDFCDESKKVIMLSNIQDKRSPRDEEKQRAPQVVVFFIPQGTVEESEGLERLSHFLNQVTITHRKKAVVVISHADEVEESERPDTESELCDKLAIDSKNVYWLQNYLDKNKDFTLDKNIVRIVLAILRAADDQLTFENFNYKPSPYDEVEEPEDVENNYELSLDAILSALPQELGDKLQAKMEEEQIPVDQLSSITLEMWMIMGFSNDEIVELMQAVSV